MARRKKSGETRIEAHRHKDRRKIIPTKELRDFVKEDEESPKSVLYPRDPSLDPQLVWKGKDEQDSKDLAVPAVPIYIQEKIHPQAIVEDIRRHGAKAAPDPQGNLFSDFNGIESFEKKVDFYHHDQNWTNRLILGDSLLVMTSLTEKEGLKGKVQTIYMDPPYGIKFGSNWQVSTRKREVKDSKAEDATRQPEQVKAFRDTWSLGVHSFLAYLRDRFVAAREMLSETGSIFVQIGDENIHLVRSLLDEVFGPENFVSLITVRKTGGSTGAFLPATADYILWFAKDSERLKYRQLFKTRTLEAADTTAYDLLELPDCSRRRMNDDERSTPVESLKGRRYQLTILTSPRVREARTGYFPITFEGKEYLPTTGEWKTNREGIENLLVARRVERSGTTLRYVRYLADFPATVLANTWTDLGGAADPIYVVQTNAEIVKRCVLMTTDAGDLVLDPTCGSGTTAYISEQWGRRWITIDTSRVALSLARTRLMSARFSYYLLADTEEGRAKDREVSGTFTEGGPVQGDLRKGFVCRRVPHVTLRSIANNPEIRRGMSRTEVDAAIARHAEQETLFDLPYEDSKRMRVTGPFTVESLSPHRVMAADSDRPLSETASEVDSGATSFVEMILGNLRKAGVQNTVKNERLTFDRLEAHAGEWIHATGDYTEKGGKARRVAVSIGPEHGTVSPEQVKEAAKEAVKGVGFDLLIVCGFAFDPHVAEEAKRYGKLAVLTARMNPDLAMGDELLKKTGAGNLFMVFGEPDLEVKKAKDGKVTVEVKGVDVYDPTTGQVRSSSTDDIACWFLDTDYDGESFFVRHAYFTGADEPYEKLKRALRAEVDEAAWSALYSTKSRPFDSPSTGRIAVKVINHYGDEVLKVYEVK